MKKVFIHISVVDDISKKGWSSSKTVKYDVGDVNQVNFGRFDGINQVLYFTQEAFREIASQVESEGK